MPGNTPLRRLAAAVRRWNEGVADHRLAEDGGAPPRAVKVYLNPLVGAFLR